MNLTNPTTIVLAEDHPLFRKALRDLLSGDALLKIIGEAGDGNQVMPLLRSTQPDVVVLDLNLPGMSGLEVARQIKEEGLDVRIIALTMHDEEDVFNEVMDAGAYGYVLKESAVDVIRDGIKLVAAGDYYITPSLAHYLVDRRARARVFLDQHPNLDLLTPTERKILTFVSRDRTSKEIAEILSISEKTVQNHRMNICNKLCLHGSNSLLKFALQNKSAI